AIRPLLLILSFISASLLLPSLRVATLRIRRRHGPMPRVRVPLSSGVTSTPNMKAYSDGEEGVGGAETRVDFGTKSWPYVYYARRDQKGTVDWGTMSWPYVYYSRRDGKGHKEGKPYNAADAVVTSAVKPATVRHGRKLGRGFRI
ncbi:hypothetical protein Taro_053033, partial [Colocasia esculenta]|nr:hypothetical protein [Colocasia esculenta]